MSTFLVKSPHSEAECLQALDDLAAENQELLDKSYFACKSGNHTGYALVSKPSKEEALKSVPRRLRDKATAEEVEQFTPEEIRSFHQPGEQPQPVM